jgi:hypothetical protein
MENTKSGARPPFCRRSKRHNYDEGKCQHRNDIDTIDVLEEESNNANLDFVENSMKQNAASR